jgi:hypothetical protein
VGHLDVLEHATHDHELSAPVELESLTQSKLISRNALAGLEADCTRQRRMWSVTAL